MHVHVCIPTCQHALETHHVHACIHPSKHAYRQAFVQANMCTFTRAQAVPFKSEKSTRAAAPVLQEVKVVHCMLSFVTSIIFERGDPLLPVRNHGIMMSWTMDPGKVIGRNDHDLVVQGAGITRPAQVPVFPLHVRECLAQAAGLRQHHNGNFIHELNNMAP